MDNSPKYFYEIDQIVGNIKIIDRKIFLDSKGIKRKKYKYKCLNCGFDCGLHYKNEKQINDYWMEEGNIKRGSGCALCRKSSKIVVPGINDITTTDPWMIDYLKDKNMAYKTNYSSNKKIKMICVNCKTEKTTSPNKLSYYGFSCKYCGDGFSYPEKFMSKVLKQLGVEFKTQLSKSTFKWCDKYKYDFYIPSLNIIIETHGGQHYRDNTSFKKSLKEVIENDKYKEKLAKDNGIENYIIIDCRKSESDWIKESILESKLSMIFDLDTINWDGMDDFIKEESLFINIKNDINNNEINIEEITKKYNISRSEYYRIKNKLINKSLIKKPTKEEIEKYRLNMLRRKHNVKVICLNNDKVYNSIVEASNLLNIKYRSQITSCCRGKIRHTQNYKFMYYEDYLYCIKNNIDENMFSYIKNKYKKEMI